MHVGNATVDPATFEKHFREFKKSPQSIKTMVHVNGIF